MIDKARLKFFMFILAIIVIFVVVDRYDIFGQENIVLWQDAIQSLGWFAPIGFIFIYTIGTMLFLPGTIFTLLGGAAFGVFWGSVLAIIGATTGAIGAYWVARLFGKQAVDRFLHTRFERITTYNNRIEANGFLTVFLLRLTPLIPYNGLNLALAYSPVKLKDYTLATALGISPGVVAYVYLGEAIASLSARNIIFAIGGIALYMVLTALLAKRLRQNPSTQKDSD